MYTDYLHLSPGDLMRFIEEHKNILFAYMEGHNLGYQDVCVECEDGQTVMFSGEVDFSQLPVREMFERSTLLVLSDMFEAAKRAGVAMEVTKILGTNGVAHVLSCDQSKRFANCDCAPSF